jgi:hypothetical protein
MAQLVEFAERFVLGERLVDFHVVVQGLVGEAQALAQNLGERPPEFSSDLALVLDEVQEMRTREAPEDARLDGFDRGGRALAVDDRTRFLTRTAPRSMK